LVTAGPTYEHIDPVRFISNHSTGKMGFAIAEVLFENGADVTLVAGPNKEKTQYNGIHKIHVVSAKDMYDACLDNISNYDIIVMSAAVADYTLKEVANEKIKKKDSDWSISLIKTKDILLEMGKQKSPNQFIVGFALETNNEKQNALEKLKKKNLDCIVLNSLNDEKAGFGFDTNKVTIIHKNGQELVLPLKTKREVAEDIANFIILKTNE
jgi:phosphopantothenoylcysteine decarboxylase/phosphopantothenate--cysteine ligase